MLIMHLAAASGFHGALPPWVEADAEKRERARYLYGQKTRPDASIYVSTTCNVFAARISPDILTFTRLFV
jgi:hypothetical protein